jgi:hypothetical protein
MEPVSFERCDVMWGERREAEEKVLEAVEKVLEVLEAVDAFFRCPSFTSVLPRQFERRYRHTTQLSLRVLVVLILVIHKLLRNIS